MTTLTNFITNNSGLLMALFLAIVGLFSAIVSKNKQQVYAKIYALVSQAQLLESATGADKFDYVFDNAYKSLPWFIKLFISEDNIKMAIEYALTKLKSYVASQMVETAKATQIKDTTIQDTSLTKAAEGATAIIADTQIDAQKVADVSTTITDATTSASTTTTADTVAQIQTLLATISTPTV